MVVSDDDRREKPIGLYIIFPYPAASTYLGDQRMIVNHALMMQENKQVEDLGKAELEIDWDEMELEMDEDFDAD